VEQFAGNPPYLAQNALDLNLPSQLCTASARAFTAIGESFEIIELRSAKIVDAI